MVPDLTLEERCATLPDNPVLEVQDLSVWYRQGVQWRPAVKDLSFRIDPGEAFGLVGESGSGKSSVAMAVLRYLPPHARLSARTLAFEGTDLVSLPTRDLRALRGDRISTVYQHPGSALNPSLTIGRQIAETLREHRSLGRAEARQRSEELLARVRVRNPRAVLDLYPHELSGGMQQRATIAMAIALEPALLVLDEPTTALDASVQAEIVAILDDLRRDHSTSVLLISHDIGLIRRATDRVGVMQEGLLIEQGETVDVLARPAHVYTRGLIGSIPRWNFTKQDGRLAGGADYLSEGTMQPGRGVSPALTAPTDRSTPALRCRDIAQAFGGHVVLQGIDLDIASGETFGLIGESGSGKSTLARIITGLQRPTAGTIELFGAVLKPVVERRGRAQRRAIQMVFQSPDMTLNPRHRLRHILSQPLRRLAGLRGDAVVRRADALIEAVRLPVDVAASRPAALSGGQRQRVAIARAFAGAPRLVVLDEPTSALDVSVQATILNLLNDLQRESGTSYLFISHDLKVVRYMADRIGVLYRGHLVEIGAADRIFEGPNHPYTKLLLGSAFKTDAEGGTFVPQEPALAKAQSGTAGCVFAERCPLADARCRLQTPPQHLDGTDHRIQCWRDFAELAAPAATDERADSHSVLRGIRK